MAGRTVGRRKSFGGFGRKASTAGAIGALGAGMYEFGRSYASHAAKKAAAKGKRIIQDKVAEAVETIMSDATASIPSIAFNSGNSTRTSLRHRSTGRDYITRGVTGKYKGAFKKPKRKLNIPAVLSQKGIMRTNEIHGTIADPDCVYISHTALDSFQAVTESVIALMRKLFEKGGFRISETDLPFDLSALGTSDGMVIRLYQMNVQTGSEGAAVVHSTVVGDTLRTVAQQFIPYFATYSSGFTTTITGNLSNVFKPHRLRLFVIDQTDTVNTPKQRCEINLEEEIVQVYGQSTLKVQNRTLAADGGDQSDDVANNPLEGRRYSFKTIPRTRSKSAHALNLMPVDNGVQLVRAAELGQALKEPPPHNYFSNCVGSVKIRLEPGNIKYSRLTYNKEMKYLKFLEKLKLQYGEGPGFFAIQGPFPTNIIALEDVINVNASQNITCAYEANNIIAVSFKTKKSALALVEFTQSSKDNVPV